jgi:hypothetical protein
LETFKAIPPFSILVFWAAHTLFVSSTPMRGAWCGLFTAIVAAIQARFVIHVSPSVFSLAF